MIAYGRWQSYVDAEPVREHVRQLMSGGLSRRRIAVLADVTDTTITRLLYGQGDRPPTREIRTGSARAILGVRADPDVLGPTARVDATGTRRRLQALMALGWSRTRLAEELGGHRDVVSRYMIRDQVTTATVRAVRALYDRLWDTTPPEEDQWDVSAAVAARRTAARNGWVPPMAWDDDTIDDPAAEPHGSAPVCIDPIAIERALAGEVVNLSPAEVTEVVRIGEERGWSAARIAAAAGRSERSIQRRRSR
jgi:hypothetical protein